MTGFQRDAWEMAIPKNTNDMKNFRANLAVLTVCDENGDLLFKPEDAELLGNKSAKALGKIFNAATKLNHITGKDVEEIEQSFSEATGDGGSLTSHLTL